MQRGPGLKKVTLAPLFRERWVRLVSLTEGRMRDVLEQADVVSEGGVRDEGGVLTYYGTTSLLIGRELFTPSNADVVRHALTFDPHTRTRIGRIAHREASSRMPSPPTSFQIELELEVTEKRITIAVDVVAKLAVVTTALGS